MSMVTIPMVIRMRDLWDAGLSYAAVAAVISLDWQADVSEHQVRWHLRFHERGTSPAGGARRGAHGVSKPSQANFPVGVSS